MTEALCTDDTIAAIATSPGIASVAIIRVSGPATFRIADEIFRCQGQPPSKRQPQTFVYGHISGPEGDIDEVLLLIMRAPHSYSCEDMIEIQGHGGTIQARRILRRVLEAGARPAEPGEFTQRAFLNGRIDLLQAEAVLDLVHAQSERAAKAALAQLEGGLSGQFNHLYDALLPIAADLEATLDFPEEDIPTPVLHEIPTRLKAIRQTIHQLADSWEEGRLLRQGATVVISGSPNVGKSTLLNALLGTERALVSPIPGTTRDTIEEGLILDGVPLHLVDTAGLRDTACEIERAGIERARRHIGKADLHLYVVDASTALDQDSQAHLANMKPEHTVIVLNKVDRGEKLSSTDFPEYTTVNTSLIKGKGLSALREAIRDKLERGLDFTAPPHAVISERHRKLLLSAEKEIKAAQALLSDESEMAIVPAATHLRLALDWLGSATGRLYQDELLTSIFSRFCIGK